MKVIQCDRCKAIITKCKKTKILYKKAEPIMEDKKYTLAHNKVFELCENCFEEIINKFMELDIC